jgi:hypothetical protein
MDSKTLFALSVADITKLLNVERLKPGTYQVEETVTLTITGQVKVGENYEQRVVAKADPWKLLLVAMSKLNDVTMESLVRESLNGTLETDAVELEAKQAVGKVMSANEKAEYERKVKQAELAGEAIKDIKEGTWTECKGKVTQKLNLQVVTASAPVSV